MKEKEDWNKKKGKGHLWERWYRGIRSRSTGNWKKEKERRTCCSCCCCCWGNLFCSDPITESDRLPTHPPLLLVAPLTSTLNSTHYTHSFFFFFFFKLLLLILVVDLEKRDRWLHFTLSNKYRFLFVSFSLSLAHISYFLAVLYCTILYYILRSLYVLDFDQFSIKYYN